MYKEMIEKFLLENIKDIEVDIQENPFNLIITKDEKTLYEYKIDELKTVLDPELSIRIEDLKEEASIHDFNLGSALYNFKNNRRFVRYKLIEMIKGYREYNSNMIDHPASDTQGLLSSTSQDQSYASTASLPNDNDNFSS